ncbi:MAG: DUF167 domain-containing protein [Candidatus Omnitrophota bacterium]
MICTVRVCPRASRNLVEQNINALVVHLTKPAADGQANNQLIELLAKHFNIKKYQIKIMSGFKSRNKIVEIDVNE